MCATAFFLLSLISVAPRVSVALRCTPARVPDSQGWGWGRGALGMSLCVFVSLPACAPANFLFVIPCVHTHLADLLLPFLPPVSHSQCHWAPVGCCVFSSIPHGDNCFLSSIRWHVFTSQL